MMELEKTVNYYRKRSLRFFDLRWFNPYITVFRAMDQMNIKNDYHHKLHVHDFYELIIPDDDNYRCILNGKDIRIKRNQTLLVQPGNLHEDILECGSLYWAITFDLKYHLPPYDTIKIFKENQDPLKQVATMKDSIEFQYIMIIMQREFPCRHSTSFEIMSSLFQSLFWILIRNYSSSVLNSTFFRSAENEGFKNSLLKIFEDNINTKLNVFDIAKMLEMSKSSLVNKCQNYFGLSPAKAYLEYRMKKIEEFVRQTNKPMKEISEIFGFENQFHFSRLFKKFYGESPSNYRQNYRKTPYESQN